jgi:hypothetical protein
VSERATEVTEAEQAFIDGLPDPEEVDATEDVSEAPQPVEAAPDEEGTTEEPEQVEEVDDPLALPDTFTPQDVRGMLAGIENPEARAAAEAAIRNFQGDYTRSKQQLAEQAKAFEGLEDLEKAKAAVEFYDGIQNDPEYAMEVHAWLTKAFEEQGLTPAQAAEAATDAVTTPAEASAQPDFDDDPDAALRARLDSLQGEVDSWKQQEEARQAQQAEDQLAAELLRQEMAISQANPLLKDEDFDRIYDLAAARGGNLLEAHQQYMQMKEDFISEWVAQKQGNVPPQEPTAASAQPPPEVPRKEDGSVDMEQLHRIADQRLRNAMAGRE